MSFLGRPLPQPNVSLSMGWMFLLFGAAAFNWYLLLYGTAFLLSGWVEARRFLAMRGEPPEPV
jgi:hypothetical protein